MRARGLLYFGFASGGCRRSSSEVTAAAMANLAHCPRRGGFVYRLDRGQTLQGVPRAGGRPDKPLLVAAAAALPSLAATGLTVVVPFWRV